MAAIFVIIELILCKLIASSHVNNIYTELSNSDTILGYLNKFINAFNGRWIGLLIFLITNVSIGVIKMIFSTWNSQPIKAIIIVSTALWVIYYIGYKIDLKINKQNDKITINMKI